MPEKIKHDLLLQDPLTEVTRKERRMLLAVSMVGVGLVKTGLVPTKIEALGVEFDKANPQALLAIIAFITLYFFAAFVVYAAADFLAWRRVLLAYGISRYQEAMKRKQEKQETPVVFALSGPVSVVRALFEFLLPLIVGVYAIQLLWFNGARI